MLKIGITGGLGSGKSTAASIFQMLDIPVYDADKAARRIMEEDHELRKKIEDQFGPQSYRDDKLNRSWLAEVVFRDPDKLRHLNSIVHPVTIADAENWMGKKQAEGFPYAIKEAALIFETDAWKYLDYVIGVQCPEDLRIKRVMMRDGLSEKQVRERMKRQMDDEEKMKKCDFILYNNESSLLVPQIVKLHQKLISLGSSDRSG